jgi:uncharacterized membrane protein YuzA (DUF378 family)
MIAIVIIGLCAACCIGALLENRKDKKRKDRTMWTNEVYGRKENE